MRILEYGREHDRTLLFLPCTAEPEWAFTDSVTLLAQDYHVMQVGAVGTVGNSKFDRTNVRIRKS